MSGAGTLVLSAVNTYTGGTTLESGTLEIASGGIGGLGRNRIRQRVRRQLRLDAKPANGSTFANALRKFWHRRRSRSRGPAGRVWRDARFGLKRRPHGAGLGSNERVRSSYRGPPRLDVRRRERPTQGDAGHRNRKRKLARDASIVATRSGARRGNSFCGRPHCPGRLHDRTGRRHRGDFGSARVQPASRRQRDSRR